MDQNQPTVDNDLQKAIDDITNTTNIDPVFSDPVAAPSSVPEGDTGELSEPVGPFPAPEPTPEPTPAPAPEPMAGPAPVPMPEQIVQPVPEPVAGPTPAPIPEQPVAPMPEMAPIPEQPVVPAPEMPVPEPEPVAMTAAGTLAGAPASALNMRQVKEAALRDLTPLINRLNMDASQKFNLYKDIFENMRDYAVLEPAYYAAKEIVDEAERAEALLYLVEAIDKL